MRDDYLLWLRREVQQTVDWAGEPTVKHQSGTLSPRASFALWREKVRDHSEPWQSIDVDAARKLADAVGARLRRLDETALAATAGRNAELFAREHEIADALQRGMLPVLPDLPGLTLSASYVSVGESAEVGGDWYDVFTLPDGSIGIAMGDVTGHDVSAAATMGQLRSILRSYAWEEPGAGARAGQGGRPRRRVQHAADGHRLLRPAGTRRCGGHGRPPPQFRYANAGHLPPVLRLPDGSAELLDDGVSVLIGVGLGIAHESVVPARPARLDAGALHRRTGGGAEPTDLGRHRGAAPGRRRRAGGCGQAARTHPGPAVPRAGRRTTSPSWSCASTPEQAIAGHNSGARTFRSPRGAVDHRGRRTQWVERTLDGAWTHHIARRQSCTGPPALLLQGLAPPPYG